MPRYLVLRKSFINGALLEEGDEVDYSGKAGSALQLISGGGIDDHQNTDGSGKPDGNSADLENLRQQYEELFGEKPHFNTGAAKLQASIDDKRKELGV